MRNQSIELINIAKDLREHVNSLHLSMDVDNSHGINIKISDNLRLYYSKNRDYMSVEFGLWPKATTVALFETHNFSNNTININVEKVDDVELEAMILLVQSDIAIFKRSKLTKQNDVYTCASSI